MESKSSSCYMLVGIKHALNSRPIEAPHVLMDYD